MTEAGILLLYRQEPEVKQRADLTHAGRGAEETSVLPPTPALIARKDRK